MTPQKNVTDGKSFHRDDHDITENYPNDI